MKNVTFGSEKWEDCSFLWEEAERKKTSSASLYEAFSLSCDIAGKKCARKMGRPGCMPFSPSEMITSCGEGHLWAERRGVAAACVSLASCRWGHVSNLLKWELNRASCSLWWCVSRTLVNKMNVSALRYAINQNHKWSFCTVLEGQQAQRRNSCSLNKPHVPRWANFRTAWGSFLTHLMTQADPRVNLLRSKPQSFL